MKNNMLIIFVIRNFYQVDILAKKCPLEIWQIFLEFQNNILRIPPVRYLDINIIQQVSGSFDLYECQSSVYPGFRFRFFIVQNRPPAQGTKLILHNINTYLSRVQFIQGSVYPRFNLYRIQFVQSSIYPELCLSRIEFIQGSVYIVFSLCSFSIDRFQFIQGSVQTDFKVFK